MTIRTVIQDDITYVSFYNRTVDLLGLYGSEYRKSRARDLPSFERAKYLLYYNLSPKLPLNRCIARIIDVDPDQLGSELFWRGDVVAMKYEPESKHSPIVQCYDTDADAIVALGNALVDDYGKGNLEQDLSMDEWQWKHYQGSTNFLNDMNELRELTGRSPILNPGLSEIVSSIILKLFQLLFSTTHFSTTHHVTGPPAFPPELEQRIFETCARSSPASSPNLVLVARRVHDWIDPILYETIIFEEASPKPLCKLTFEQFVDNLDRKPPEFYSKHIKNLWITTAGDPVDFLRALTLCRGVENLVLFPWRGSMCPPSIPFQNLNSYGSLRRLTLTLEHLFSTNSTAPDHHLNYPSFTNITHLHRYDEEWAWPAFTGFENLRSLTHLAFSCCGPDQLSIVMPKLPAIEYVALCSYNSRKYGHPVVKPGIPVEVYGLKVVRLDGLTRRDWESGTAGRTDFWDVVEKEVTRRRTERYIGHNLIN